MPPAPLYKLFWSFCHESLTGQNKSHKVLNCCVAQYITVSTSLLMQLYAVCQTVAVRLVRFCMCTWICVHQIPKHFDSCVHSVVIIKSKSYAWQGHSWSSQIKALCWSTESSCPLGKHSGLQSSAAWGCVFSRESSTSHRLFKIPRERLHIPCTTVCFWTPISYFRVDYWMNHFSFNRQDKGRFIKLLK